MLKTAGKCYKNTYEAPKNKSVRMQKQENKEKKEEHLKSSSCHTR